MAASAGGLKALTEVLSPLPPDFPAAIVVVQHLDPRHRSLMAEILDRCTALDVRQVQEGDVLCPGTAFIAPPDNHLLVNPDGVLSLSKSELVHFLRPSADLLFRSVAASYGERAIAVVLTGSGSDGSMGVEAVNERVKIYATDVDEDALNRARQGTYSAAEIEDVPEALRDKYFDRAAEHYVLHKDLRSLVIFGRHDLVQDAPISHLNLLVRRNTLIYFNAETQSKILSSFRFSINRDGFLFLGKSETLLARTDLFTAVEPKQRVFTRVADIRRRHRDLPTFEPSAEEPIVQLPPDVVRDAAFETAHVGHLVVDLEGFLVAANHEARALFGLSPEDLGRTLQDLDLDYYRPLRELRSQIERAYAGQRPSSATEIEWPTAAGEARFIDVQVVPVAVPQFRGSFRGRAFPPVPELMYPFCTRGSAPTSEGPSWITSGLWDHY